MAFITRFWSANVYISFSFILSLKTLIYVLLFLKDKGELYHDEDLDHYIDQLLDKSTPQAPVWNIEKIKKRRSFYLELH